MSSLSILWYTLIPVVAAVIGATVAAYRRPGPVIVSAIQHFAAGVVFAAAAGEILPGIKHEGLVIPVAVGGGIGIVVMLLVRQLEERIDGPVGLLTIVGIDMLIDGLVLGLGFVAGGTTGILLTIALTLEVLFLGLTVATGLSSGRGSPLSTIAKTFGLVLLLPVGALLSIPIGSLAPEYLAGFFSFGLIALLYLVTEELLVEAHETPDRPWVAAMFFVGFLLLLLLEEAVG